MSANGFTAIPNAVLRDTTLSPSSRFLYGVMLSYAWGGRRCTASSKRLAAEAGIGRSAFFDAIRELAERKLLKVEKQASPNGLRNVYTPLTKGIVIEDADEEGGPKSGRGVVRHTDGGSSATRTEKKTKGEEDVGGKPPTTPDGELDDVTLHRLFRFWQDECGHPQAKFTGERKRAIKARLREGYTAKQVGTAIRGAALHAYVDNAGKRHDDLTLICRNGSKLEDFIGRASQVAAPPSARGGHIRAGDMTRGFARLAGHPA